MRKLFFSMLLLAFPAYAAAKVPRPSTLAGPVTYEVASWGKILVRWQINPDGTGEIWRNGPGERELRKFRLTLEGDAMQTFVTNVEDARAATRREIRCKKQMFDLPYGSITWDYPGAKQTYSFDSGCFSKAVDEVQEILTAASSNVEALAKIEPKPYIIEPLPQR